MPRHITLHCERRCAPFVQMQAFRPALTRSFALPTGPELTFAPHPDAEITPSAGRQVHTYPLYSSTEGLRVRPEKQLQKYGRLAVPKAVPPLRTEQSLSSLAQLITISLSVFATLSCHHRRSFSAFLFLPSSQFINFFQSHGIALHPAISAHFHWLVRAFSTMAADEVSHMKPHTRSPNHSPQTTAKPDPISTTILPICKSRAKGL